MKKIQRIAQGFNVAPLAAALRSDHGFWDQDTMRTASPDSPHHGVSDIFVRYAADPKVPGPHESVWYPCADVLPVKALCNAVMKLVDGECLGGVLITKIPPRGGVKPHIDRGWHAETYRKFCVQVESAPGQKFVVGKEELEAAPGDVYEFRNEYSHYVTNPTDSIRVSLIVCIQTDKVFS